MTGIAAQIGMMRNIIITITMRMGMKITSITGGIEPSLHADKGPSNHFAVQRPNLFALAAIASV